MGRAQFNPLPGPEDGVLVTPKLTGHRHKEEPTQLKGDRGWEGVKGDVPLVPKREDGWFLHCCGSRKRRVETDRWVSSGEVTGALDRSDVNGTEETKPVWSKFWETGMRRSRCSRQITLHQILS